MPQPFGDSTHNTPLLQAFDFRSTRLSGTAGQIECAEATRARVNDEFDRVSVSFETVAQRQCGVKRSDTEAILWILEDESRAVLSHDEAGYFVRHWQAISD